MKCRRRSRQRAPRVSRAIRQRYDGPQRTDRMARDQQGLALAGAPESADAFNRAMADYYGLTGDPVGVLKSALARDPGFALGGVAIAALYMIGGFRGDHPEVMSALRGAEAAIGRASQREQNHLASRQGLGAGRVLAGDHALGADPGRSSHRRARFAARAGRLFLSRPVGRHSRLRRAGDARLGSRQSARWLRPRALRLRARGDRRSQRKPRTSAARRSPAIRATPGRRMRWPM